MKVQNLQPIQHDRSRDYSHFRNFGSSALLLPQNGLGRSPVSIKDQGDTQYCTGFTIAEVIENQVGIEMSPAYQVAKEGELKGSPILFGADPLTALKSGKIYGALPETSSPFSFAKNGVEMPALYMNWDKRTDWIAYQYRRPSFYSVTQGTPNDFDIFDSIRLALWDARTDKAPVIAAGFWYNEFQNIGRDGIAGIPRTRPITRHMYTILDWKFVENEPRLIVLSHQGTTYGDNGIVYLGRDAINQAYNNFEENGLGLYLYRSTQAPIFERLNSWLKKYL